MKSKILTAFMATTVTAAIVLPAPNASATLSDLPVNHSHYDAIQTAERVATSNSTVPTGEMSLTITSVTGDTVRTSKGNFTTSKALKPIFNSANRQALQNAKATVVVKNEEIIKVSALTLNTAGTNKKAVVFDGGDGTIAGNLTVSADYLKIQNVTIEKELIVTNRVKKSLKFDSVEIENTITFKPQLLKKVNWLNVYFVDTPVPKINVQRTKTMLISDKLLSTVHATKKASILEVEADVGKLVIDVESDFSLYGKGKIEQVLVDRGDDVSLDSSHTINKVQINDKSAKVTLAQVDKAKLNSLISSIKYASVSINGNEVYTTDKWTTQAEKTVFDNAVASAQAVARDTKASQTQVNDAYKNLNSALANYQAVQKSGKKYTAGDKTTLTSLINSIQYVTVSWSNGNDVASYTAWTTQAEKNAIDSAVTSARAVVNNSYATYDQISSAINNLNNAITIYNNAKKYGYYGYGTDKSTLEWTIRSINYVTVSTNGYDVPSYTPWTTQAEKNALEYAVSSAQAVVYDVYATADQVSSAIYNLNNAISIYNNAQKYGYNGYAVDKSSLSSSLNSVTYVAVSTNGYDVSPSNKWTTSDVYYNFVSAVSSAREVMDNSYATQDQVNAAYYNLTNAIYTYSAYQSYGLGPY